MIKQIIGIFNKQIETDIKRDGIKFHDVLKYHIYHFINSKIPNKLK